VYVCEQVAIPVVVLTPMLVQEEIAEPPSLNVTVPPVGSGETVAV
jgi:hypothetical protein